MSRHSDTFVDRTWFPAAQDARYLEAEAVQAEDMDESWPGVIRGVLCEAIDLAAMPIFFVSLFVSAVALVL